MHQPVPGWRRRLITTLVGNPVTKARQINVDTLRGVVQLSGFVDDAAEKSEAGRIGRYSRPATAGRPAA